MRALETRALAHDLVDVRVRGRVTVTVRVRVRVRVTVGVGVRVTATVGVGVRVRVRVRAIAQDLLREELHGLYLEVPGAVEGDHRSLVEDVASHLVRVRVR